MKTRNKVILLIVAVFIFFAALGANSSKQAAVAAQGTPPAAVKEPEKPAEPAFEFPAPGDKVTIRRTIIAETKKDLERAVHLSSVQDNVGLNQMASMGSLALLEANSKALVLDISFTGLEVRMIGGNLDGAAGWIIPESVLTIEKQ